MPDRTIALVLSGGNALGAFQAGAYSALHARGIDPQWIAGVSMGAINGALIAGNAPENRIAALERVWQPGASDGIAGPIETWRRTAAVHHVLAQGKPGIFAPRLPFPPPRDTDERSLFDTAPLRDTLDALVDFDRLNDPARRYAALAVDVERGEDVAFDTHRTRVGAEHVRASAALLPMFAPVEIDGRWLVDGGLSLNLPLDAVLDEPPPGELLCIAIDLMPLRIPRPATLGEAAARLPDLAFAIQSRRAIEHWRQRHAHTADRSITLLHIDYREQHAEVAAKAFDYSPASVRQRWDAGAAAMFFALDRLAAGDISTGRPGLSVWRADDQEQDA